MHQVNEMTIAFALPDFVGDLKPGDRLAVQLLYAPDGHEPLSSMRMHLAQMMRMQRRDWPWPVMTNRLEFLLTAELLAKRENRR